MENSELGILYCTINVLQVSKEGVLVLSRESNSTEKIEWPISVPIFKNSIIIKQLGIAIGIPFGILILFLLLETKGSKDTLYALGLIAAVFMFSYVLIRILWGGKYDAAFILDSKGIRCYTQKGQARKNRVLNALTVILGVLSGKPAIAGVGLLAHSRQDILIKWHNIKKVRYHPKGLVIIVRGAFAEQIAIFCTIENYEGVEAFIKSKIAVKNSNLP